MWSSPSDLRTALERRWNDGSLLASFMSDDGLVFPLRLPLRRPSTKELGVRFEEVREWIRRLQDGSKSSLGFGYELEWSDHNHRQLGQNRVPTAAIVPTREDALHSLGRTNDAHLFAEVATQTVNAWPALTDWIKRRPLLLLEHMSVWPQVLTVLRWFADHPCSGLYVRQIDLPGVDTKFIESYRGLLSDLLAVCLPPLAAAKDAPPGARGFEPRYGLASKPALLRVRLLDPALSIGGFCDLSAPMAEWQACQFNVSRVFITENEINGLCFPPARGSAVIFGLGYGVDRLAGLPWLKPAEVFYWGDIDTHGFAMLDRVRALLPQVRSLLMDATTLFTHRAAWVTEPALHTTDLHHLTAAESALFDELRRHVHGAGVRLEQERVAFGWLNAELQRLGVLP